MKINLRMSNRKINRMRKQTNKNWVQNVTNYKQTSYSAHKIYTQSEVQKPENSLNPNMRLRRSERYTDQTRPKFEQPKFRIVNPEQELKKNL